MIKYLSFTFLIFIKTSSGRCFLNYVIIEIFKILYFEILISYKGFKYSKIYQKDKKKTLKK